MIRKRYSGKHPHSHAREIAMQSLYQFFINDRKDEGLLDFAWLNTKPRIDVEIYARKLLKEITENEQKNNRIILTYSDKDITQISLSVRAILNLGIAELNWQEPSILLDDLLDLVRKYDGEESVAFVNGILGKYVESKFYQERKEQYAREHSE